MKIKTIALATALLANVPVTASDEALQQTNPLLHAQNIQTNKQLKDQYIVLFKPDAKRQDIEQLQHKLAYNSQKTFKSFKLVKGFSGYLSKQQKESLAQDPNVALIEPNLAYSRTMDHELKTLVSKNAQTVPWGLDRIDQAQLPLDNSFAPFGDGTGVHAYIIDSGIHMSHSEFANRVVWDFTASDINDGDQDGVGYGTHLAGIVGGSMHGIAKNVTLHAVKVTNNQDQGTLAGLIEGIEYVANNHIAPAVAVVGVSMPHSAALNQAILNASAAGVSIAVPSGDEFRTACNYSPASAANSNNGVISVAASTQQDQPSPYSNVGNCVDIYAPGLFVKSTWHSTDYANNTISHSPTAAAHVAGVAAVIRGFDHSCSNVQVKNKLLDFSFKNQLQNLTGGTINRLLAVPTELDESDCNGVTNQPPTITGTPATSVLQDELYQFSPVIDDPDQGDSVTISINNKPSWAQFDTTTGQLSGFPTNADVGVHSNISITATDSELASTQTTPFNITVINVNDAPTITSVPSTSATQGQAYQYVITADDIDVGDRLTFAAPTLPSWLSFNPSNETLQGTPENVDVGSHSVQLTVTDGQATTTQDFQINVNNVNDAPSISGAPAISVSEDLNYSFTPSATDPDNDSLSYSITGKPAWASFNPSTGQLSGNPNGIGDMVYPAITISVSDGELTDELTFSLTVVSSTYSDWTNTTTSGHSAWTPAVNNQTSNFSQTRTYQQTQTRQKQSRQLDSQSRLPVNIGAPVTETRQIEQSQSRSVTVSNSGWSETGRSGYTSWSPAANNQTSNFTQSRNYTQSRERTWSYTTGASSLGSRVESDNLANQSESRTVAVSWSGWSNSGGLYNCGGWSPATNTVGYNISFTQSRSCTQDQTRSRNYSVSGSNIASFTETNPVSVSSQRSATGVGNWEDCTVFGAWTNSGSGYNYGPYSPSNGVRTSDFTQSRSYQQDQTRTEQRRECDTLSNATRNIGSPIQHSRTVNSTQTRLISVTVSAWSDTTRNSHSAWSPSAGTQSGDFNQSRNYTQNRSREWYYKHGASLVEVRTEYGSLSNQSETRRVNVSVSGWSNTYRNNYSEWSPTPSTQTSSFNQTRSFTQHRLRTWNYKVGSSTIHSRDENGTTTGSESRPITVTNTGWIDGSETDHSDWSPTPTTQTSNFTQTQTYTQIQSRHWYYKYGNTTLHSRSESRGLTNQSRARVITVSYSAWVSGVKNCSSWSPSTDTHPIGHTFTQTRSCSFNETRNRIYKAAATTIRTAAEVRSVNATESQTATGTLGLPGSNISLTSWGECGINDLSWTQPSGRVDYYEIWRDNSLVRDVTFRHFSIYATHPGTARVRACNNSGCGGFSNSVSLDWSTERQLCH